MKVKRWIALFEGHDGSWFVSGEGMKPYLYASKEEAEEILTNEIIVEIEVEE